MTDLKQLSLPEDLFDELKTDKEIMRGEIYQRTALFWPDYFTGLLKCRVIKSGLDQLVSRLELEAIGLIEKIDTREARIKDLNATVRKLKAENKKLKGVHRDR